MLCQYAYHALASLLGCACCWPAVKLLLQLHVSRVQEWQWGSAGRVCALASASIFVASQVLGWKAGLLTGQRILQVQVVWVLRS